MTLAVPTLVAPDNAGNDIDYDAWVKTRDAIRAMNAGQFQGFKNRLINGAFDVWQRGTSFAAIANGAYGPDRWWAFNDAVADLTLSRIAIPGLSLPARYCARLARTAGTARFVLGTNLETASVEAMKGRSWRVSVYLRKGSALSGTMNLRAVSTNTEAKFGSGIDVGSNSIAVASLSASVFTRLSADIAIPAASAALGLGIEIEATSQAGGANVYFEAACAQMEPIDATSPQTSDFEARPYAVELLMCQRFYQQKTVRSENGSRHIPLAPMRAAATITVGVGSAANITADGFELSHSAAADCAVTASAEL